MRRGWADSKHTRALSLAKANFGAGPMPDPVLLALNPAVLALNPMVLVPDPDPEDRLLIVSDGLTKYCFLGNEGAAMQGGEESSINRP